MIEINTQVASLLLKVATSSGRSLLNLAGAAVGKISEILGQNFAGYYERTIERCSNIKTLISRDVPVPLDSIYVPTFLKRANKTVDENSFFNQIPRLKSIVVTGTAGSGKTVFMRHLFLRLAHSELAILPVFVELRGLNSLSTRSLLPYIYHTVTGPGATITEDQFVRGVKLGTIYLILDGFDEIDPDHRKQVEEEIVELQKNNARSVVIVSSRHDERFFHGKILQFLLFCQCRKKKW